MRSGLVLLSCVLWVQASSGVSDAAIMEHLDAEPHCSQTSIEGQPETDPLAAGSEATDGVLQGRVMYNGYGCQSPVPPCTGPLANYEVVVYAADGSSVVARALSDDAGKYQVQLAAGDYVIYTGGGSDGAELTMHRVTVEFGAAPTLLNLSINAGTRTR